MLGPRLEHVSNRRSLRSVVARGQSARAAVIGSLVRRHTSMGEFPLHENNYPCRKQLVRGPGIRRNRLLHKGLRIASLG
jgi:hypothetical protein